VERVPRTTDRTVSALGVGFNYVDTITVNSVEF
jgi:hypothetical protein